VRDDTEIDWKNLPDEDWNMWSAHALQRRWLTMKRSIKGHEDMSHAGADTIIILYYFKSTCAYTICRTHGHLENEEGSVTSTYERSQRNEKASHKCRDD
jgi:hypothetical protein